MFNFFKSKNKSNPFEIVSLASKATMTLDFDFENYAKQHIFNQISKKSQYGYYYFPFGYLFRYPKWGKVNEMGFRCPENIYQIRQLYPDHKIVAVFGGSTVFSILVSDEQTFSQVLESKLNADTELFAKLKQKFKVVNFGQCANVVLNQMLNYILYSPVLKPDIIVSHHAAGDLITGQINDRKLISKYNITYVDVFESWGCKIHDNAEVDVDFNHANQNSANFRPVQIRNKPEDVIKSYHARVMQFSQLVQNAGLKFISGFQPWVTSKAKLSKSEEACLRSYNPYYQPAYSNIPMLYDLYDQLLEQEKPANSLNLHRIFREFDDTETHFGDVCHTLAPGDLAIANAYYQKIREMFVA